MSQRRRGRSPTEPHQGQRHTSPGPAAQTAAGPQPPPQTGPLPANETATVRAHTPAAPTTAAPQAPQHLPSAVNEPANRPVLSPSRPVGLRLTPRPPPLSGSASRPPTTGFFSASRPPEEMATPTPTPTQHHEPDPPTRGRAPIRRVPARVNLREPRPVDSESIRTNAASVPPSRPDAASAELPPRPSSSAASSRRTRPPSPSPTTLRRAPSPYARPDSRAAPRGPPPAPARQQSASSATRVRVADSPPRRAHAVFRPADSYVPDYRGSQRVQTHSPTRRAPAVPFRPADSYVPEYRGSARVETHSPPRRSSAGPYRPADSYVPDWQYRGPDRYRPSEETPLSRGRRASPRPSQSRSRRASSPYDRPDGRRGSLSRGEGPPLSRSAFFGGTAAYADEKGVASDTSLPCRSASVSDAERSFSRARGAPSPSPGAEAMRSQSADDVARLRVGGVDAPESPPPSLALRLGPPPVRRLRLTPAEKAAVLDQRRREGFVVAGGRVVAWVDGSCQRAGTPSASAGIGVVFGFSGRARRLTGYQAQSGPWVLLSNTKTELWGALRAIKIFKSHLNDGWDLKCDVIIGDRSTMWEDRDWRNSNGEILGDLAEVMALHEAIKTAPFEVQCRQIPRGSEPEQTEADRLAALASSLPRDQFEFRFLAAGE